MDNMNMGNNELNNSGQTDGLAIASLVLGIASIIMTCCITYVAIVLGIVGIVLAVQSNKKQKSGLATAGLVCSIIGIAIAVICIVIALVFGTALSLM